MGKSWRFARQARQVINKPVCRAKGRALNLFANKTECFFSGRLTNADEAMVRFPRHESLMEQAQSTYLSTGPWDMRCDGAS